MMTGFISIKYRKNREKEMGDAYKISHLENAHGWAMVQQVMLAKQGDAGCHLVIGVRADPLIRCHGIGGKAIPGIRLC